MLTGGPKKQDKGGAGRERRTTECCESSESMVNYLFFSHLFILYLPLDASSPLTLELGYMTFFGQWVFFMYKWKLSMHWYDLAGLFFPLLSAWMDQHALDRSWLLWPSSPNIKTVVGSHFSHSLDQKLRWSQLTCNVSDKLPCGVISHWDLGDLFVRDH